MHRNRGGCAVVDKDSRVKGGERECRGVARRRETRCGSATGAVDRVEVNAVRQFRGGVIVKAYLDEVDKLLTKPVVAAELIGAVDELLADGQSA